MLRAACVMTVLLQAAAPVGPPTIHAGKVVFTDLPVPGATIVASRGERRKVTSSDESGEYRFEGLEPGTWKVTVEMGGFRTLSREIAVPEAAPARWELSVLSIGEIRALADRDRRSPAPAVRRPASAVPLPGAPPPAIARPVAPPSDPPPELAADSFIIDGSVSNAAASPFAQPAAFGNNRRTPGARYNGTLGVVFGASALDARPFSFAGTPVPRPNYTDAQVIGVVGGPLKLPTLQSRPTFFAAYQMRVDHNARTRTAIVPTVAERAGDLSSAHDESGVPLRIIDPVSGLSFPGSVIPDDRLSPQARALLALYPLPNVDGDGPFNYQHTSVRDVRQHTAQLRITHRFNPRHLVTANVAFQRTASEATTLLGFFEESRTTTWDVTAAWIQRLTQRFSSRYRYQLTHESGRSLPEFAHHVNVSGDAGIEGNAQDPANWGPPNLLFSRGTADLVAAEYQRADAWEHAASYEGYYNRGHHNLTFGGELRPRFLDVTGPQLARGAFTFTGAFTGHDFADFLLGVPSAMSLALADGETRLRSVSSALYFVDEMRMNPHLTLNVGARWEFESPFSEQSDRLVNLDVAPYFSAVAPVRAGLDQGPLSGKSLDSSLLRSDWRGLQPRLALTWRPPGGRSLVIRAGYGVYRTTGVYEQVARLLTQQPPVARTFNLANSSADPATMATALGTSGSSHGTFGVDPEFRQGHAHTWQASAQRNLPGSLTATVTYTGSIGRGLPQQVLPNTYPEGGTNPCPACPTGFVYLTSAGSSSRHAGQIQLRRRMHGGWTASVQYTLARAVDDAASFGVAGPAFPGAGHTAAMETGSVRHGLNGATIAQDWRAPELERGPSPFDQRHNLMVQAQYTTGVGHASSSNRAMRWLAGWTVAGQLTAGSGLPFTPVYSRRIGDTGFIGVRPSLTGLPVGDVPDGLYLNPQAFGSPPAGEWGDVGRNSSRGPRQFSADASVARSFARGDRMTIEWRLDATNVLNRVTYVGVGTVVGTPQFGRPIVAAPMRKLQMALRLRF